MKLGLAIAGPLAVLAVLVTSARAAEPAAGSKSAHEDLAAVAVKWPADVALTAGMKAIRAATLDVHTLVTHRRMPPDMAQSYAANVKRQAEVIRSAASVRAKATADEVEALLTDIVAGAEAVAGRGGDPIDGIIAVDEALKRYGATFADPDWKPLR